MTSSNSNRRTFVGKSVALAAALGGLSHSSGQAATSAVPPVSADQFRFCLNTSTINNREVPIREQIKIAADAGYDSIEFWVRDVQKFTGAGGKLTELAREIADRGLLVDSAIAFGNWIVDDEAKRKAALEQCRRDMEIVRELGGSRIAAPPSGATREAGLDLRAAANRYRDLLEVGKSVGVVPQLELWGFSKNVSTLEEVLYIAAGAQHPEACILLDVYHMYKGGSDFSNVDLVPANKMHCLHMNDYPDMDRATIADKDRVYPGDGVGPVTEVLNTLVATGFEGVLSLELFNPNYWKQDASVVLKKGLESMKAAVAKTKMATG